MIIYLQTNNIINNNDSKTNSYILRNTLDYLWISIGVSKEVSKNKYEITKMNLFQIKYLQLVWFAIRKKIKKYNIIMLMLNM